MVGNHAPGLADEKRQDFKFRRAQPDGLAAARGDMVEDVDFQRSETVDGFLASGPESKSERGTDPREQLSRAKGRGGNCRKT